MSAPSRPALIGSSRPEMIDGGCRTIRKRFTSSVRRRCRMTAPKQRTLPSHWWWDLSARDFAALDTSGLVAVLPVGAVEQHGPHLPVRVDAAINEAIVARAVAIMQDSTPVLVLPALAIGKSNEHIGYPGTLSLSHETLINTWLEIGTCVHRAGIERLLIFNSHGGQPQIVDIVCRELRVRHRMLAVGTMWSRITPKSDLFDEHELKHGIHGGELETSVMLASHPDLVQDGVRAELSVTLRRSGISRRATDAGRRRRLRLAGAGSLCRRRLRQRRRRRCRARRHSHRSRGARTHSSVRRDFAIPTVEFTSRAGRLGNRDTRRMVERHGAHVSGPCTTVWVTYARNGGTGMRARCE